MRVRSCIGCEAGDGWTEVSRPRREKLLQKKKKKHRHLPMYYTVFVLGSPTGCRLNARMNPITPAAHAAYIIRLAAVSAWLVPIIHGDRDRKSRHRYRGPDRPRGRHVWNHWGIRAADRVLAPSFLAPTRGHYTGYRLCPNCHCQ